MPRKAPKESEATNAARIKEGRGQGTGKNYKPWLRVQDVSSDGRAHRTYSYKTKRVHHFLSDIEKNVFLALNWSKQVLDIREQFPLRQDDTLAIAQELRIKHPFDRGDVVMTSDFFVDTDDKKRPQFVLQVKHSDALKDPRIVEKLEIERRYWILKEIPWLLVTEKDIDPTIRTNLEWLSPDISDKPVEEELLRTLTFLNTQFVENPNLKFIEVCKKIDSAYNSELGQALKDTRRLMANGFIQFDITKDFRNLKSSELSQSLRSEWQRALNVAN